MAAKLLALAEPHCIGMYSICESVMYVAGLFPQSYCQVMRLFVWLALFKSPGVSPAEKARPRFMLVEVPVGELLLDVLVELVLVLDMYVIVLVEPALVYDMNVLVEKLSVDEFWVDALV